MNRIKQIKKLSFTNLSKELALKARTWYKGSKVFIKRSSNGSKEKVSNMKLKGFMSNLTNKFSSLVILIVIAMLGLTIFGAMKVHAATATTTAGSQAARISFTFDDSLSSAYTNAAPTLAKYGLTGTDYAISGCVGMTTEPNTCNANQDTTYMSWTQLEALQNTYGWEIGSHTVDHDCLASSAETDPSDCANAKPLTTAQVDAELANSQSALASHGITATDFAPPYGDYNNNVMAQIAKYYASMRQFKNAASNANQWPYSDYYLQDTVVLEKTDTVADVEAQINTAIANKQWIVLTFHDIETNPSKTPDNYQYGTAELAQIAAYVQSKQTAGQIQSVHVDQGLSTSTANLLPNSTFDSGIADGWTTDAPKTITKDTANNGSYPSSTNSIKLVSTSATTHLFSPKVSVTPGTTYILKDFLNVQNITSGYVGFYIDEYNANGQWISGQWKTSESSSFVEDMNFAYVPSSAAVSSASLQVIVSGNPGITAYLDNSQWFTSTVPVAQSTNLIANGTFTAGIADGWTTDDPKDITADTGGNGSPSSPTDSVSLKSSTTSTNGHLFSPQVAVTSTKTYSISSWLNLKAITNTTSGVVGYYVDEYNASGTWISGKYITGVNTVGAENVGFIYTPSSANVTKASLQVIVVGNAGIQAYIDNVDWTAN
jgi:peptidoglycan/xylan/chitin deacetylase (PgdA/CDA1 family)